MLSWVLLASRVSHEATVEVSALVKSSQGLRGGWSSVGPCGAKLSLQSPVGVGWGCCILALWSLAQGCVLGGQLIPSEQRGEKRKTEGKGGKETGNRKRQDKVGERERNRS